MTPVAAVEATLQPGIVLAGTLDTKAEEIGFLRHELERRGNHVTVIDCGILGEGGANATISNEAVARAGGGDLRRMREERNRETAIPIMIKGLEARIEQLQASGRVLGFIGIGGGTNAALAAAAFRKLDFGIPKILVSTVASGNTRPFIGMKDVVLLHSVVDVLGLSAFLREVLSNAAAIMTTLVAETRLAPPARRRGCAAITAFGTTTPAATQAFGIIEHAGMDVMTFHARGVGGEAMEAFIRDGHVQGVLDLTTTEIADEIVGGICSAGPDRLTAAAETGIPQVVLPGAIDIVNFGPPETVPARFAHRLTLSHTPHATLMRTTPEENVAIAHFIAKRLNAASGPVAVVIPLLGFSAYDAEGGPFWNPDADAAFRQALCTALNRRILVHQLNAHINDPLCAQTACTLLLEMMRPEKQGAMAG